MQKSNDSLLNKLESLMRQKKSREFYAKRLGISVEKVEQLMNKLKGKDDLSFSDENSIKYNADRGTVEVSAYYPSAPTPEDIIRDHNIDTTKYKLSSFWSKQKTKGYQISALFSFISKEESFSDKFIDFLKDYKPEVSQIVKKPYTKSSNNSCLIFNKQDAHLNKLDVNGKNDLEERFFNIESKLENMLKKAQISSNLHKVIYVIGSDQLNSEHTDCTTKGTPQQNVMSYQEGFERICQHEINSIRMMLAYSNNVEVIYVPGNHDEYAGWHVISWLAAYFRNQGNLTFDIDPQYSKYVKYYNTAIMFNHGDGMKPEKMAQNFPIEFREEWSSCNHYYIFTGDKHTELSKSIGGIKFYQIPALSNSKSKWDLKNGYTTTPAEMTGFVISQRDGISDIYKELI